MLILVIFHQSAWLVALKTTEFKLELITSTDMLPMVGKYDI